MGKVNIKQRIIDSNDLTEKQKAYLEIIWTIDSFEKVLMFMESLPLTEQYALSTIVQLVYLEYAEYILEQQKEYKFAEVMLERLRREVNDDKRKDKENDG